MLHKQLLKVSELKAIHTERLNKFNLLDLSTDDHPAEVATGSSKQILEGMACLFHMSHFSTFLVLKAINV